MTGDEAISSDAALMPLINYDFSPLFSWLADENGVNWQLMVNPSPGETENTDAAAKTTNPIVIPHFMWTGNEPQAAAATEVYNQLFGSGDFMTLDSPGMHKFTFGDGVAMRTSGDFAKEVESIYQALGLTDAGIAEGMDAVVKPGVQPQPNRFGVYWTLQRYLRVNAIVAPTTKTGSTAPIENYIIFEEPSFSFSLVAFGFCWLLIGVPLLDDLCATCCDSHK